MKLVSDLQRKMGDPQTIKGRWEQLRSALKDDAILEHKRRLTEACHGLQLVLTFTATVMIQDVQR